MKKNRLFLFIFFIIVFLMQGCNKPNLNSSKQITAPENKLVPIQGTWKISKYKSLNNIPNAPEKTLTKATAEFNQDGALFNDELCKNPEYKIKVVNSSSYFLYNFKLNFEDLGIKDKNIQIISVTCKDKLFYDFIRINEKKLLVYIDGCFFSLDKISDKTTDISSVSFKENEKDTSSEKHTSVLRSGVLLGVRSSGQNITDTPSKYRTLWISAVNKEVNNALETEGLFVPRKSSFWEIDTKRASQNDFTQDNLYANPIDKKKKQAINDSRKSIIKKIPAFKENLYRNILFVGNDYICTEYSTRKNSGILNKLQVLPIDNIQNNKGIKISDLTGDVGKNVFTESANSFLSLHKDEKDAFNSTLPNEESFTLIRKNGHWITEGRLNSPSNPYNFANFDINIFPPKKMLNYDELYVSWNTVKSKVPSALDAFTSPNNDIALIVCKDFLYVYGLSNGALSNESLQKISIGENESIVMAEWATGTYMERWQDTFKSYIKK